MDLLTQLQHQLAIFQILLAEYEEKTTHEEAMRVIKIAREERKKKKKLLERVDLLTSFDLRTPSILMN